MTSQILYVLSVGIKCTANDTRKIHKVGWFLSARDWTASVLQRAHLSFFAVCAGMIDLEPRGHDIFIVIFSFTLCYEETK